MKRIALSLSLPIGLMLASLGSTAQTCSMSTTNPTPNPAFNTTLAPSSLNGFSSDDQGTLGTYDKGAATSLMSPVYSYNSAQTQTFFKYHLATPSGTGTITSYTITLYVQGGATVTCTNTVSIAINSTGADYYFILNPVDAIPANKYFRIKLTMTLTGGSGKDIIATAYQANAILAPAGIVLPVQFSSFEVTSSGTANNLLWQVGAEENLSGYDVEKSTDGRNFSKIAFVQATGSNRYAYTDGKASGTSYYRIKSVDQDGKYGYSPVVAVKKGTASTMMNVFPMPFVSSITVQHEAAVKGSMITISSSEGRIIKSIIPVAGSQQSVIDLSSAQKGIYLLSFIKGDGQTETMKLIKQ